MSQLGETCVSRFSIPGSNTAKENPRERWSKDAALFDTAEDFEWLRGAAIELHCSPWAKTIKKNTNSTQNKSETHHAKQYEVTSFLSTDCELSTETCSKNVYSLGPLCQCGKTRSFSAVWVGNRSLGES